MSNLVNPFSQMGHHKCDNCGIIIPADFLHRMENLWERLDAGGMVPSGQCPGNHAPKFAWSHRGGSYISRCAPCNWDTNSLVSPELFCA